MHFLAAILLAAGGAGEPGLKLIKTIADGISPKSVVHSGGGLFFAQNMMYRHTVAVYGRDFKRIATIPDVIEIGGKKLRGSPVECAFSPDGKHAWVSNYRMFGKGYSRPGNDGAQGKRGTFDRSYLYRIDTAALKIDGVVRVGSVPKFVAATPDGRTVLVSNWCSSDLSVVDTSLLKETRSVPLGRFPRGIAVSPDSKLAYVALMGTRDVAIVSLSDNRVEWIRGVGASPRHLCLSPDGRRLYVSLNGEGRVARIDLDGIEKPKKAATGSNPRSMALSADGASLFVVNYGSNTLSKVRTEDMKVVATVRTKKSPIGVAYDDRDLRVWVACYSGSIQVFQDAPTTTRNWQAKTRPGRG